MKYVKWFARWMVWLFLAVKEVDDYGDHGVATSATPCALGMFSIALPLLAFSMFRLEPMHGALIMIGSFAMYLTAGLFLFFAMPSSNAGKVFPDNGAW